VNRDQSFNKNRLITSGFPRSGNVFLNYALKETYYPDLEVLAQTHVTNTFKEYSYVITPIRNPLDCIASWNQYQENFSYPRDLNADIAYYLRFYSYVIKNPNNIRLLDFDIFTVNIEYITNKITAFTGIELVKKTSLDDIKSAMINDNKASNLPRDTFGALNEIKDRLKEMNSFTECIDVYTYLKLLGEK